MAVVNRMGKQEYLDWALDEHNVNRFPEKPLTSSTHEGAVFAPLMPTRPQELAT
jgi:hypothetical protein